jgi:hypothetical protein
MPCGKFWLCHMSQSKTIIKTIIMDDGDQYFEKKIMSKNLHSTTCQILINRWQLMMLAWHHECSYYRVTINCIVYMVICNSIIHATCSLTLITYKYSELQGQFQNTFFFIVPWHNFESSWLVVTGYNVATWDKWKSLEIMLNNNI